MGMARRPLQPAGSRIAAIVAIVLATPAVVGTIMTEFPRLLRPGDSMPLETAVDRVLVWVFSWGVLVAFLSLPTSLFSWALASYLVWRNGRRDRWARAAGIFALAALVGTGVTVWRQVEAHQSAEKWLRRNAAVECPGQRAA